MWDLPRPGLEPVSPALAGGFLTTVPPGSPSIYFLHIVYSFLSWLSWWILTYTKLFFLGTLLFIFNSSALLVDALMRISLKRIWAKIRCSKLKLHFFPIYGKHPLSQRSLFPFEEGQGRAQQLEKHLHVTWVPAAGRGYQWWLRRLFHSLWCNYWSPFKDNSVYWYFYFSPHFI